tara:strand:- start:14 stop:1378 length:1365 start_codon:yes stop_codon:yes gene_type:complete
MPSNKPSNNNTQREVPYSIEAERAVLGSILINPKSINIALQKIDTNSFYDTSHQLIYSSMKDLNNEGIAVDTVTLIEKFKKEDILEKIGGGYYITGLSEDAPSSENIEYYIGIVKEKEILRTVIDTAREISSLAYDSTESSNDILDKAEQRLFNLSQSAYKGRFLPVDKLLQDVLEKWENRKAGDMLGIGTGFHDLDSKLSGLQKSDLIIVAGRPSMGKTAFALNIASNVGVLEKKKVGIFSLEMSDQQLVERMIASEAKVDSHLVRTGKLPKNDWKNLSRAAGPLSEANIFIDDSAGLSILELKAKARQLKSEHEIDVLIVDYIQLLHVDGRNESRQQEISLISRSLKSLAKDLNIPIIALSQLSRAPETRTDHRPIMSDLRESGAIEQDADIIIFLYRKFVYSKDEEDKGAAELIISKHRNGPTGIVNVSFIDKFAKFENMSRFESELNQFP